MTIFRKGELVRAKVGKYNNKIGVVAYVSNLDKDIAPFVVSFYFNEKEYFEGFSHDELELANNYGDEEEKQYHYIQASLCRMRKKV